LVRTPPQKFGVYPCTPSELFIWFKLAVDIAALQEDIFLLAFTTGSAGDNWQHAAAEQFQV